MLFAASANRTPFGLKKVYLCPNLSADWAKISSIAGGVRRAVAWKIEGKHLGSN